MLLHEPSMINVRNVIQKIVNIVLSLVVKMHRKI